jgi:hypothetical protein
MALDTPTIQRLLVDHATTEYAARNGGATLPQHLRHRVNAAALALNSHDRSGPADIESAQHAFITLITTENHVWPY